MSNKEMKISDSDFNKVIITGAVGIMIGTSLGFSPEREVINQQLSNIVGHVIHETNKKVCK